MGLLSNAKSLISAVSSYQKSLIERQKKAVVNVVDTFKAIGTNIKEKKFFTGVPVAAKYENTLIGNVATNLTKPATLAAAAAAPALIKTGLASAAIKGTIKKPDVAAKYAIGGIITAGVLSQSNKPLEVVKAAPNKLYLAGQDIGRAIEGNKSVIDVVKDNKEVAIGAAALGGVAISGVALNAYNTLTTRQNTAAVGENTKTMIENAKAQIAAAPSLVTLPYAPAAAPLAVAQELKPEVVEKPAEATTTKKQKKKAGAKKKKKKAPKKKKAAKRKAKSKPKKKTIRKKRIYRKKSLKRKVSKGNKGGRRKIKKKRNKK